MTPTISCDCVIVGLCLCTVGFGELNPSKFVYHIQLQWKTNTKSYVTFQMAPVLVTLGGLEGHFCCLKHFKFQYRRKSGTYCLRRLRYVYRCKI